MTKFIDLPAEFISKPDTHHDEERGGSDDQSHHPGFFWQILQSVCGQSTPVLRFKYCHIFNKSEQTSF